MSNSRRILRLLALLITMCVVGCVLMLAARVHLKRTAQSLLTDMRSLRVESSTASDVQTIVRRYDGLADDSAAANCQSGDAGYSIRIANETINRVGRLFGFARRLGFQPSGVVATFALSKDRLCYAAYSVQSMLQGQQQELLVGVELVANKKNPSPQGGFYELNYWRSKLQYQHFVAQLSDNATPKQREHAFDIQLSCLERPTGCRTPSEVMPSAWQDYETKARAEGDALPPAETTEAHCKKF